MRPLWLSSPALGSCITNLGHLLASNHLAKIYNLTKSSYGPRYQPPPWTSAIQILVSEARSEYIYSFLW